MNIRAYHCVRNIAQLVPKRTVHDKFPKAPDITPTFRTAYLEVITVGVRDLKPYGFQVRNGCRLPGEKINFPLRGKKRVPVVKLYSLAVAGRGTKQQYRALFSFHDKLTCSKGKKTKVLGPRTTAANPSQGFAQYYR